MFLNMKKIFCFLAVLLSITCFSQVDKDSIAIEELLTKARKYQAQLRYDETYRILLEAVDLAQKNNFKVLEFKVEIAIANMYVMKEEMAQAKEFFENKFPDESFPPDILSYYYHRKAFYYNQSENQEAALAVALRGIDIATEHNFKEDLIILYHEIAFIYENQGKFDLSQKYYDKVLELVDDDDLKTKTSVKINKARLYTKTNRFDESNTLLEEALTQIDSTGLYQLKIYLYGAFSSNYHMMGDSTNYYKYRFLNVDEALNTQKQHSESQYKDLQVRYQIKEKDALIEKKNTEQKELLFLIFGITVLFLFAGLFSVYTRKKNKSLTKLLHNNNFLLSELNHRTKNNLQLIVSLAARESKKDSNDEITSLANLTSKIESIATLHQQLYLNEQLDSIQIKNYIEEILVNLSEFLTQNKIEVIKEIDSVEIGANQSLYMGLLINELTVNSIKHAFPTQEKKQIELSIKNKNKYLEIQYQDNGVGVPTNSKVKLISTLSRQLEADFKIENRNGFYYFAKIKV
jgi:two-component sensor histidine kinase